MGSEHNNNTSHFLKAWRERIWEVTLAPHRALSRHEGYFRNKFLVRENKTMTTWCVCASFRKAECLWSSDPFALKPESLLYDTSFSFLLEYRNMLAPEQWWLSFSCRLCRRPDGLNSSPNQETTQCSLHTWLMGKNNKEKASVFHNTMSHM